MPSPGPTLKMAARKVRMGDVLFLTPTEPRAVVGVIVTRNVDGSPLTVALHLDDGGWPSYQADALLDVTRPFTRHATTGAHDA